VGLVRALLLPFAAFVQFGLAQDNPGEFFEMRVRPVLASRCLSCHASGKAMGGLALDTREALLRGGKSGPSIEAGNAAGSLLLQAVRHQHENLKMPMGQPKLSEDQIKDLAEWVTAGAPWPEHSAAVSNPHKMKAGYTVTPEQRSFWAFRPIVNPPLPKVTTAAWVKNDIDRFVLAKLEQSKLNPNRAAGKRDLIRRVYFTVIGLPPTSAEVDAFVQDDSPDAFAAVVDRLLASQHYGERWARHWLDVARYSDDKLEGDVDNPYPSAFQFRDWVVRAFNQDMPYDIFVKAQIAGDLMDGAKEKDLATGLGFYGIGPELADDRVDVTTRGFLALTGACAQCHDHKFDPIPTRDYYAMQGVFSSTKRTELALAPADRVDAFKAQDRKVKELENRIQQFLHAQATQLSEILASQSPAYIVGARRVLGPELRDVADVAAESNLDQETLARWVRYLKAVPVDNHYLDGWEKSNFDLEKFRKEALKVLEERKKVDEENLIRKAGGKGQAGANAELVALPPERFFLWRDLFFSDFYGSVFKQEEDGILYYGPNRGYVTNDGTVERFLNGQWKTHLASLRAELNELKRALPAPYPYAHVIADVDKPRNVRIQIGGQPDNLGEEVPRAFLSILSDGPPKPFQKGSGRLELAEAVASPSNPLTARVMVNRVWQHTFGYGLVRTVSNFGRMGDTPSHPELLDWLAFRFIENGWSVKKLQREILLSATYQLSADYSAKNFAIDPSNRLLWRANRHRLDVESMRDALLAVSGELDRSMGGEPQRLAEAFNLRRTLYGYISRRKLDPTLALFDFPNPNASAEQRLTTPTPLQQLFFMNSSFIEQRAAALASRADVGGGGDPGAKVQRLYRLVLGRPPQRAELAACLEFVSAGTKNWQELAKLLLSSNELIFLN
jgi:cytochrome c553